MIKVSVRHDVDRLIRSLERVRLDQIPFAIAKAVTSTAQIAKKALQAEMPRVFDRPTPYTLNSLYLKPATKANPTAVVGLKDDAGKGTPAAKYLLPQIEGGGRTLKRFEKALQATGQMPRNTYAMPGDGAKLDAYGNMNRGQLTQILSALKSAEIKAGFQANRTERSRKRRKNQPQFFSAPKDSHLHPGVYQRFSFGFGSAIKPVLIFTHASTDYSRRYRFQEVAADVVAAEFGRQFRDAYEYAIRTAR